MRTRLASSFAAAVAVGFALGVAASLSPPADASRNSSGTYTLPTGNPVVPGTTISTNWANSTLRDAPRSDAKVKAFARIAYRADVLGFRRPPFVS